MSTRFEILRNGERVCISGINGDGVLSFGVTYVKHANQEPAIDLHTSGLGSFDGSRDGQQHAGWPTPEIGIGDEITVRILPAGQFDEPDRMTSSPKKTLNDPELGDMDYYIDAWVADISFSYPPFENVRVHLRADDSGPTKNQRHLLRELSHRHSELWPEISSALIRCHETIETIEELENRINSRFGVDLYDNETDSIAIRYNVDGDPEHRAYFVTLRNWKVTEIVSSQ